jgi:hypothetical protein
MALLDRLVWLSPALVLLGLCARRGEVGALRWMDCDFRNEVFYILHSNCWRRGGHFKATRTEASAKPLPMHSSLKNALLEWKAGSLSTPVGIRRGRKVSK